MKYIVTFFVGLLFVIGVVIYLTSTRRETENPSTASARISSFETDARLQSEADSLLKLFDNMPPVPVYVSDAPIVKTGTNTERGVAYTNCDDLHVPSIVVKTDFYKNVNEIQRTNILKHELTHAWLCRQRLMNGHDENFRRKFESVGGFGN